MDVFGPAWTDHMTRLEKAWTDKVKSTDTVLIGGDTDWSLRLEHAMETLLRIDSWSGQKILLRGNHDYWWSSKTTSKVRRMLPTTLTLLHNNALEVEGFNLCGTKGSPVPGGIDWTAENAKLLNREMQRLQLSLEARRRGLRTIAAFHYPPFYPSHGSSPYREELERHGVVACVYGHLHGDAGLSGPAGQYETIEYTLVAGDAVSFTPVPIAVDGQLVVGHDAAPWRYQTHEKKIPDEHLKNLGERAMADKRQVVGDDRRDQELWEVSTESASKLAEQQEGSGP